jgi:hypothetical protein
MLTKVADIAVYPVHQESMSYFKKVLKVYKAGQEYLVELCVETYVYKQKLDLFELSHSLDILRCEVNALTQDKYIFGRYIADNWDIIFKHFFYHVDQMFWTVDDRMMTKIVDVVVEDCEKEEVTV